MAVERPEDWKWSSYRATAGMRKAVSSLTVDWILGQFGDNRGQSGRRYKEFIVAGLKEETSKDKFSLGGRFCGQIQRTACD